MIVTAEQGIIDLSHLIGALTRIMAALSRRGIKPSYCRPGPSTAPSMLSLSVEFRKTGFQLFCHVGLVGQQSVAGRVPMVEVVHDFCLFPMGLGPNEPLDTLRLLIDPITGRIEPKPEAASSAPPPWLTQFVAIETSLRGRNIEPDQAEEQVFAALAGLFAA